MKLQGNLGDEYKDQVAKDITIALDKEDFKTVSYVVSGKPVLDSFFKKRMKTNMVMMVGLAVVIMLIVLAFVFKVKWRMLSLGIILSVGNCYIRIYGPFDCTCYYGIDGSIPYINWVRNWLLHSIP